METHDVLQKIEATLKIIDSQFPSTKLSGTMKSIKAEMDFIRKDLERAQPDTLEASKEDVQRIILGIQAVREIESQNAELSELLCDIDFEYEKLYGISMLT